MPRGAGTLSNPQLENVNSHLLKQRPVVIPTNDGQYLERDKTVSLSGELSRTGEGDCLAR